MNNIYKVIWSKAKNCYVVASEIVRSHTKSASGSEKIGGVTRRSLLASLMALSLLCGGLGVASAANGTVHVAESSASSDPAVYTTEKVNTLLNDYGKKTDVEDNKNNIATLQNTTTTQGQKITENATNIARNTADIAKKIDTEMANERFAAKVDLTALQNQVTGKVDENTFEDALYDKADRTYVDTEVGKKANKATTLTGYGITDAYTKDATDTAITTKVNEEKDARELKDTELSGRIDTLSATVDSKVSKTDLNTTLGNYYTQAETNAAIKTAVDDEKNARENAINGEVTSRNKAIADAIAREETNRDAAITKEETKRKEEDAKLEGKITENTTAINNEKAVREAADTDLYKRIGTVAENGNYIEKSDTKNVSENLKVLDTQVKTNAEAIAKETADRKAAIGELAVNGNYIEKDKNVSDNLVKLDNQAKANAEAITKTNQRTAGITRDDTRKETSIEGKVTVDTNGNIKAEGTITSNGLDAKSGDIKTNGKVSAGDISTGTLETTGNATIGGNLDVTGTLNIKDVTAETIYISKSEENTHYKSEGSIIGEGGNLSVSNKKFDKRNNITKESQLNVDEEGTVNWATSTDATGNKTEGRSEVTADKIKNSVKKTEGGKTFGYEENITEAGKVGTATDKDGNTSSTRQDSKGVYGYAKDKDGNKSYTKQEGNRIAESVIGQDGKQTKSEMTSTDITNTAKDGTITSDAKDIVNKATGKISNSSATMDTTVTGKATESYGELETEVKGNEKHTVKGDQTNEVDGKQINTIKNGQGNIISGGQTNTITGGQINNITGDQTTTITGNKTETVTENVTEDYKKNLTTTVGGNENHEVKGTKTETVEGKVTENYKAGQATNVTGDQDIMVSGTQTTTATDINRNASRGMIDTIDNDYGTNTETKVAGKTTTDVSIKGTGEEGKYIRGANESRDYLIKGTLKNSETKTVEKTSTEITDGNGKTSATIQDVNNLAGSVTNGTETGVSGIHANDNSVSIDSIVTDGNKYSVINQKKGSIQSTVVDGTNSTVILQDKDNVTIASSKGMVAIGGKDIVNNAQDTITNTAGTKITDTAGDSTVTTEKAKGTTFTKTGSTAYSTEAGAPTDTNIAGNHITTGRVDANELGVSDKDDQGNTADFSVKAGEGIKGSATDKDGNKTYTKVTATENSFQVQDKDGNIKNHQVNTKDKSENTITNGTKANTVTSTADGTTFNNSKANTVFEGGTHTDTTIKGNTITTGKVTMDYADVMRDLGVRGNATVDKDMTVKGNTTLGEAGKDTTLTVNSKATFNEKATFEKGAEVKNGLTVSSGGLNVTGESTFNDKVTMKNGLDVTGGVTSDSFTVKGTDIKIDSSGINAGGTVISNVADGSISEGSKDAVNGGQLYQVKNDLEGKVNKVGANAAAMANLHPMEFDPSSKWNIAAAMGNYGSETATAIGAFYRPNEDVMVNFSTAFGTGENMVGGGVSVRLGKGSNKLSREESNALKAQVNDLTARMDALLSVLNPNMSKDFPDVPENHWAYEAVSRLAGNDIVQGYPDGEFHGERTMTRYEMAEIIYNALSRGAEAEKELVEEFKPELQAMAASEKATAEKAEG